MLYEEIWFYGYWYDWPEGEKRTGASLITAVCENNVNSQIFASRVVSCAQIGSVVNESARSVGNELMVISAALLSTPDGPSDGEMTRKVLQNAFYNNPTPLHLQHC